MDEKYVIHLVPHTHYDAIWVFTKEDYFYINIDIILKAVIKIMEKSKDYKFLIEQTYLLEEIERRYPRLFDKIKKYIKEGRIEVADGEYLMADTMLPQEETLIREILIGKKYLKEKFNLDIEVMWQADSFGLNAQLPQIYRKCGYKYLAFRRGSPENKPSEFLWEGLDKTRILTHFMPLGYRAGLDFKKLEKNFHILKELAATNHILMPSGSGVTMPQPNTEKVVKKWNKTHKNSKMIISTSKDFFKKLEESAKNLPIRKGEMYSGRYSEVFPDVASSRIWIKKSLRKYENWLNTFERFSTIKFLIDNHYPEEIYECWKKLLFLAFHDVAPGTGVDEVYEEVKQNIKFLKQQLTTLTPKVLKAITSKGSQKEDIIVYNPFPWDSKDWVEVDLNFEESQIKSIGTLECEGEKIDIEILKETRHADGSIKSARIGFIAEAPPLGYRTYKILERGWRKGKNGIKVLDNTIRNRFFELSYSPKNGLIKVKMDGEEILKGNEIILEEEIGDLYNHKEGLKEVLKRESSSGIKYGAFKVKDIRIGGSDLRKVLEIKVDYYSLRWPYRLTKKWKPRIWRHKSLACTKKIIIYRDIPRIDFEIKLENKHPRTRIRVLFETPFTNPTYNSETQFGAITRKTDQYYFAAEDWKEKPSGTSPSLRWIAYEENGKGVALLNLGNPEHEIRDGNIYLTLLRSVDLLSTDGKAGPIIPVPDAMEFKEYTFKYSIYPYNGNWKESKVYKMGYEFNYGLIGLQLDNRAYKTSESFLEIRPDNIILTALKRSEERDHIIMRFYEAAGKNTKACLRFFKKPKSVEIVNMLEEKDEEFDKEIIMDGESIKLSMDPFEIVTLKLEF
ncbi:alpha-mannosidase [Methanothermobacter tenebrarum]